MIRRLPDMIEGHPVIHYGTRVLVTGICFGALLWLCGWVVRPDLEAELPKYSEGQLQAAATLRAAADSYSTK